MISASANDSLTPPSSFRSTFLFRFFFSYMHVAETFSAIRVALNV